MINMEKPMNWISVVDSLPPKDTQVLIVGPEHSIIQASFCSGPSYKKILKTPDGPNKTKTIHYQEEDIWITQSSCCYGEVINMKDITHWMNLPKGPE
jgi:hypothetical protein